MRLTRLIKLKICQATCTHFRIVRMATVQTYSLNGIGELMNVGQLGNRKSAVYHRQASRFLLLVASDSRGEARRVFGCMQNAHTGL